MLFNFNNRQYFRLCLSMKNILGIVALSFILYLNPINIDNAKADHYKKGIFFSDPYVSGCIFDLLDASFGKKCAQSSLKYYFHEGKHRGSMNKAFDKCYAELRRAGFRKYRGFNRDDFSVECWDYN